MWPIPQFPADLVTFTEEILNGKLHFLYCVSTPLKVYDGDFRKNSLGSTVAKLQL